MHQEDDIQADWTANELSVLGSAKLDAPPHGSAERTLTALGVGAALSVSAALGSASSLSGAAKVGGILRGSMWFKWLGVALVGGGVAGAVLVERQHTKSASPVVPKAVGVAPAVALAPTSSAAPEVSGEVAAEAPSSAAPAPIRADALGKSGGSKEALAAEIRMIDEARDRLRRGDAPGSLETLARYDQMVKHGGSMRAEATVVRIEAFQASGNTAQATALGQRFLAKNPGSPYADYVKRILAHAN